MNLDVLVFCAHPDDAELSMGGTIAKFAQNDMKVGIVDFTRGELGTRGNADIRQREAFQAAIILKVATRENLHVPDGDIQINKENLMKVIIAIRRYKPKIIFAPYQNDRHPDHIHVSKLVKRAFFYSGLPKIKTFDKDSAQDSFRPKKLYYYMQSHMFEPSFIVDISDTYETKMNSIRAFSTQFHDPSSKEPDTFISQPGFINFIESRSQIYGFKIGKKYGEPFYCEEETELDIVHQVKGFGK
ncbi:MAG: bacillithiol biosynthesis deacetylase BshB1 [Ignavibacteriales bacterium]|nr:bacillithiol biosynthesis deacetylase BshB1 [Ignavibacteriales bacterium]